MFASVWRRSIPGLISIAVVLLIVSPAAYAEKRVALVIGNGNYGKMGKLTNPPRDAAAVEKLLRGAGFGAVELQRDLGNHAMRRSLREFADKVREADIAVVFYAGHGIEVNGANYLIPVDAVLETDLAVEDETVPLERVSQILEQAKRLRLVILDACRDNPFVRSMRRTISTRSIGRGLANVEVLTSDTLIAFAAKAGSTAEDGLGANSPYTSALVKHLTTPGLDVRLAFGRVRDEVLYSTKGRQEPNYYGSLGGAEIALVPAAPVPPPSADAARVCREVEAMSNAVVLAAMAAKHMDTLAADCIAARLEQLKQIDVAKSAAAKVTAAKSAAAAKAAEAAARAKADVARVCTNAQSISNVIELTAMMAQHRGTPVAVSCISARIEVVEKQRLILTAPKAPATESKPEPPAAHPPEPIPPSADPPPLIGADGRIRR
jgi:Caspase domain